MTRASRGLFLVFFGGSIITMLLSYNNTGAPVNELLALKSLIGWCTVDNVTTCSVIYIRRFFAMISGPYKWSTECTTVCMCGQGEQQTVLWPCLWDSGDTRIELPVCQHEGPAHSLQTQIYSATHSYRIALFLMTSMIFVMSKFILIVKSDSVIM